MPSQIDGLTSPGSFGFFHQPPPLTWRVTSEPLGGAAASVYFSHSLWNRIPPLEQKDLLTRQPHGKHHRGVIVHEWKLLSSLPPPHQHHQLPLNADTVIHKHHHTKVCWSCAVTQTLWLPLWIFFYPWMLIFKRNTLNASRKSAPMFSLTSFRFHKDVASPNCRYWIINKYFGVSKTLRIVCVCVCWGFFRKGKSYNYILLVHSISPLLSKRGKKAFPLNPRGGLWLPLYPWSRPATPLSASISGIYMQKTT